MRQPALWDADDAESFGRPRDYALTRIGMSDVADFCRRWHYTRGPGAFMNAYGLWDGWTLVGVATYNNSSRPAVEAVFGPDRWSWVMHMGRLVCAEDAPRNTESRLIGLSLKQLKKDRPNVRAVLSYAAQRADHVGTIYQATNAIYTGLTEPGVYFVDQSGRHRAPKQHGNVSIPKAMALGWTVHRDPPKHRYIYLLGSKTERKEARRLLQWDVLPYPKKAGRPGTPAKGT